MRKTFQFRIYPNKYQKQILNDQLEQCRWLYNHLLEQKIDSWKNNQVSISMYDQHKYITQLKHTNPSIKLVYSQVLQDVATRIDLAFQSFFRRCKAKENPGFPRFKGEDRYDSMTFKQAGFQLKDKKLKIFKVGSIKIVKHRAIKGEIKTLTIKRNNLNQWFACFSVEENEQKILPKTNKSIGIDVGLESFATYSDGTKIDNPRFLKQSEEKLSSIQSQYSKHKGKKVKKKLNKLYIKISNQRKDFCHKLSREIINNYDIICIEDLNINKMVKNHQLAKTIYDAAWNQFAQFLIYKAEEAGRAIVQVNPAYTSQDCSSCGYRVAKKLSEREHKCPNCGLNMDRDLNASLNILRLGTSLNL